MHNLGTRLLLDFGEGTGNRLKEARGRTTRGKNFVWKDQQRVCWTWVRGRVVSMATQVHLNPVSPGRLRKSLGGNGNGPKIMPINDDAAEREANRQRRRSSLHGRRTSLGGNAAANISRLQQQKLSNDSLSALYSSTIKMLQDNKINAKNSWTLNLLDHIDDIVQINDENATSNGINTNFQIAGCSLDAGARIYSHRVDSVHNNVFKVRGGLLLGRDDDKAEEEEGGADEDQKTKKSKKANYSTLETNLANITSDKVEVDYGVDPLFQKMSAAFDEGGARGMLLNTLSIGVGCEIIFDSNTVFDEAMAVRAGTDKDMEQELYDLGDLRTALLKDLQDENKFVDGLCPVFTAYRESRLNGVQLDPVELQPAPADDVELSFEYGENDFDTSGANVDTDAVLQERMLMASLREDEEINDEPLAAEGNEFPSLVDSDIAESALFNVEALRGWAGPTHWRFRAGVGAGSAPAKAPAKEKRPRGRTAMLLDFDSDPVDVDFAAEFKPLKKGAGELSKAVLEKMKERKNTLPEDLHYRTVDLTKLFLRPEISILSMRRPAAVDDGNDPLLENDGLYDFNNDCDNENFCPAVADLPVDGDPDGLQQLSLVEEPETVAKMNIKYASVAKKLDVRVLKDSIWNDLCDDGEKRPEKDVTQEGVNRSLQEIVEELPQHVPKSEMQEVSISYVFICLLHLANEKGLDVTGSEDLSDLTISTKS